MHRLADVLALDAAHPSLCNVQARFESTNVVVGILTLPAVAMFFCGAACVTANSRSERSAGLLAVSLPAALPSTQHNACSVLSCTYPQHMSEQAQELCPLWQHHVCTEL